MNKVVFTEEKLRDYPLSTLQKEADRVCESFNVPETYVKINKRLGHGYVRTTLGQFKDYSTLKETIAVIEIAGPHLKRKYLPHKGGYGINVDRVLLTLHHELAHYIQKLMYGYTKHDDLFWETVDMIRADYENHFFVKLTEYQKYYDIPKRGRWRW